MPNIFTIIPADGMNFELLMNFSLMRIVPIGLNIFEFLVVPCLFFLKNFVMVNRLENFPGNAVTLEFLWAFLTIMPAAFL